MAHEYDPIVSELDEVASELEKTGNADLATIVDEVAADLLASPSKRKVAAQKPAAKAQPKAASRAKKNRKPAAKTATSSHSARLSKTASAMRKIARAQVAELEDIAAELLKEGEKKKALEVLKMAQELESDYDYSADNHSSPESKGDASKRYDRAKANKPDAKMDAEEKESLEYPFGEKGQGYPLKQSSFDRELEKLLRLAEEQDAPAEEESLDLDVSDDAGDEESLDLDVEESDEDSDEDSGDLDLSEDSEERSDDLGGEDADDMDLTELDLGDGEDEIANLMNMLDSGEDQDVEAADRMYESEETDLDLDLEESSDDDSVEVEDSEEVVEEDAPLMDDDSDVEGMDLLPDVEVQGPGGTGVKMSSADQKKMVALAKKLAASGEKELAKRVAGIVKASLKK